LNDFFIKIPIIEKILMFFNHTHSLNEEVNLHAFCDKKVSFSIKREDLVHPFVSGNKFRKLKYNLLEAQQLGLSTVLTFGGAYSNHIAAVAAAGNLNGFKTIGIIRGEELGVSIQKNPTLDFAESEKMKLLFVSRETYRLKDNPDYIETLKRQFGEFYLLPEGGTNSLAVKGCEEILCETDGVYDYVCASVGTGGTLAGLINASKPNQNIVGFSALKGTFQNELIKQYSVKTNYHFIDNYCFGGYAKIDSQLIRFINEFREHTGIPLDPVYTGKMIFGIIDLLKKGYFKENSRILAVHTGGLQGITGMNQLLKKKNLPQIII
jgi:1-aminocyclopropane-1-carboxylate deaminase